MPFYQFPGSDFHDLNLDWLLQQMKNCLAEWEETKGEWTSTEAEWAELKAYVENYFANLDVSEEINDKIAAMVEDGSLLTLIAPTVSTTTTSATEAWLAAHVDPATGYVVDTTLSIAGAAADAKAAGDGIRWTDDMTYSITESNRNLWEGAATVSVTARYDYTLHKALPAGTYTFSANPTSTDVDGTICRIIINDINGTVINLNRGSRNAKVITAAAPITKLIFLAGRTPSESTGDTASYADFMIESGNVGNTAYVAHKWIAIDTTARNDIRKRVKYVSTTGNDTNSGDSPTTAYAHLMKALQEGAEEIYIAHGTYTETMTNIYSNYTYKAVRIVGDDVTINAESDLQFRYANVYIEGINFVLTNQSYTQSSGLFLYCCTGEVVNCSAASAPNMGFRLDSSTVTLINCIAHDCGVDGFNGHTIVTGRHCNVTLIDCVAYNNGDDGLSIHESGKMRVIGGCYYNNTQAGIAPHQLCSFEILGAIVTGNGNSGIEAFNPDYTSGGIKAKGYINSVVSTGNTQYGLNTRAYDVTFVGCAFGGNTSGTYNQGSNASVTLVSLTTT